MRKYGTLSLTKQELQHLIADYLIPYVPQQVPLSVEVTTDGIIGHVQVGILGAHLSPAKLVLRPFPDADGNVVLKIERVEALGLGLPKVELLKRVLKMVTLPDFVSVDLEQALFNVHLDQLTEDFGMVLRAKNLELSQEFLVFHIFQKNS